jgi:hypothetical protein
MISGGFRRQPRIPFRISWAATRISVERFRFDLTFAIRADRSPADSRSGSSAKRGLAIVASFAAIFPSLLTT